MLWPAANSWVYLMPANSRAVSGSESTGSVTEAVLVSERCEALGILRKRFLPQQCCL